MAYYPLKSDDDRRFMLDALELARKGKGLTAPNPCVGAVLVKDGRVAAGGFHTAYGQAHAEVEAIADAAAKGVNPADCVLYVTLEPCNHHGKTPPCTEAVLAAGIKRVVVGTRDPNPGVEGGGIERLRAHGVHVDVGAAGQECADLIADFVVWNTTKRTYNLLKLAGTLDGRIATRTGHSQWITGHASRQAVHRLRSTVQAVMVGGETFRQDDPRLTCRVQGQNQRHPLAVIVTSNLPDPRQSRCLLRKRPADVIFWTTRRLAGSDKARALTDVGCRVWGLPGRKGALDLEPGFVRLREETGSYRVLCEGGGRLAMSMIEQNLVDEFHLYLAPKILGDARAKPLLGGRVVESMDQAAAWRVARMEQSGEDVLMVLRPKGGE